MWQRDSWQEYIYIIAGCVYAICECVMRLRFLPRCIVCNTAFPMSICPSVCLSVRLSNVWIVTKRKHLAKKVQLWLRKSPTSFPMSLRWTVYIAPNPQRGPQRRNFFCFPYRELDFPRRKSAAKFLCVKTFSSKVVMPSLACLSVHKWLVDDAPLYLKFWIKDTHPLLKRRFPVYIRS